MLNQNMRTGTVCQIRRSVRLLTKRHLLRDILFSELFEYVLSHRFPKQILYLCRYFG